MGFVGFGNLGGFSLWSELVGEFGGVNSGFGRFNEDFIEGLGFIGGFVRLWNVKN